MPALLHFFCHFFTFYAFWHNTLHSQALENFFFLFYVMKNSSHQKINGTTIQLLVPLFFFSFLHLFHPSLHPSIHPSIHPHIANLSPWLKRHLSGCTLQAAFTPLPGLQPLRAASHFKAHSALVSAQRRTSLCRNQHSHGNLTSKYTIAYIYVCIYIYAHIFFFLGVTQLQALFAACSLPSMGCDEGNNLEGRREEIDY